MRSVSSCYHLDIAIDSKRSYGFFVRPHTDCVVFCINELDISKLPRMPQVCFSAGNKFENNGHIVSGIVATGGLMIDLYIQSSSMATKHDILPFRLDET